MMWSTEIHRLKYIKNGQNLGLGRIKDKKYQSWLWEIMSWKKHLIVLI